MRGFKFTKLEADEKIVFGPVTSTRSASFSGGTGQAQSNVSKTTGHTVGVTTQRVIQEDINLPDKTRIISNADVQRVLIKRKQRQGRQTITLSGVQAASGQSIKLNLQGLPAQVEGALQETFPNAEIALDKSSGCGCPLAAAILLGFPLLALVLFSLSGAV